MFGGLVFGTLSDKFGRRTILLVTMFTPTLIGVLVFFITNYIAFVILRFVLGFLLQVSCKFSVVSHGGIYSISVHGNASVLSWGESKKIFLFCIFLRKYFSI
jgi:MFS family permease